MTTLKKINKRQRYLSIASFIFALVIAHFVLYDLHIEKYIVIVTIIFFISLDSYVAEKRYLDAWDRIDGHILSEDACSALLIEQMEIIVHLKNKITELE